MPHWDKINLENLIFFLVNKNKYHLVIKGGLFFLEEKNILLDKLIALYNAFFGVENKDFLLDDNTYTNEQEQEFWAIFEKEEKINPLFPGVAIYKKADFMRDKKPDL